MAAALAEPAAPVRGRLAGTLQSLDDALHAGARIVALTGADQGSRDATLTRLAAALTTESWPVLRLRAPFQGPAGLQARLAEALGRERAAVGGPADVIAALPRPAPADAAVLLIVDDAHLMGTRALQYLALMQRLAAGAGVSLRLLLAGDSGLVGNVLEAPALADMRAGLMRVEVAAEPGGQAPSVVAEPSRRGAVPTLPAKAPYAVATDPAPSRAGRHVLGWALASGVAAIAVAAWQLHIRRAEEPPALTARAPADAKRRAPAPMSPAEPAVPSLLRLTNAGPWWPVAEDGPVFGSRSWQEAILRAPVAGPAATLAEPHPAAAPPSGDVTPAATVPPPLPAAPEPGPPLRLVLRGGDAAQADRAWALLQQAGFRPSERAAAARPLAGPGVAVGYYYLPDRDVADAVRRALATAGAEADPTPLPIGAPPPPPGTIEITLGRP